MQRAGGCGFPRDAKGKLSSLEERAAVGEGSRSKAGQPKARLVPCSTTNRARRPGSWEGKVWIADAFNDPLPDGILERVHRPGMPLPTASPLAS